MPGVADRWGLRTPALVDASVAPSALQLRKRDPAGALELDDAVRRIELLEVVDDVGRRRRA